MVLLVLVMLVVPLPPLAISFLFALNIAAGLVILAASLYIHSPAEFSSFPSVLLATTLMRLALNVATARAILLNGYSGPGAAGQVIESFGQFAVGGNYVVGGIIFIILIVINFMVVTKGAGRVAEVSARFMLDSSAGPADGDRRRNQCRHADAGGGGEAPRDAAPRGRFLRRDGRRLEIRARRRGRGDDHSRRQHGRRPAGRHVAGRAALRRCRAHLHPADRGRRARRADPLARDLHRRRPGRHPRLHRRGYRRAGEAADPPLPAGAGHRRRHHRGHRPDPADGAYPVPAPGGCSGHPGAAAVARRPPPRAPRPVASRASPVRRRRPARRRSRKSTRWPMSPASIRWA